MNDAPDMPKWATEDGPWCLRQWMPMPSTFPHKYDLCLLPPDHTGDCRTIHYGFIGTLNGLQLGRAQLRAGLAVEGRPK